MSKSSLLRNLFLLFFELRSALLHIDYLSPKSLLQLKERARRPRLAETEFMQPLALPGNKVIFFHNLAACYTSLQVSKVSCRVEQY